MQKPYLYIDVVKNMGRGVFTKKAVAAETIIETAPVIVMSNEDRQLLDKTLLHDYIFEWGENADRCCIALGLVSMYNHSYQSNCEYFMDFENHFIAIKTVRQIKKGEQLTINYNGDWNNGKSLWFDAAEQSLPAQP